MNRFKVSDKAKAVLNITTTGQLQEHMDDNDGFCIRCGEWTYGGCEPDAHDYECESCGSQAVYGAEELIFLII
jgi:hypothetical protein